MRLFLKSVNPYSMRYLALILSSLYESPMHDYKLNEKKIKAVRMFIFFVSYLLSLIKTWPYYKSKKLAFTSKIIFVLLRRTVYWLFFIPFIKQLSKFLEYLCSFFGVFSVVRASILTNFSLSALFIARYIMIAIKNGFNYLDIVFPIRKTLNSFMALRVFESFARRKSKIKDGLLKKRFELVDKRVSVIIAFVLVTKYKLFMNNLINYSYYYNMNFYNKFCLIKFNNVFNVYYKNIYNICNKVQFNYVVNRSCMFKRRFYATFNKKIRFFELFKSKITAEIVEKLRREKRKPLTFMQKFQYNEKRRVKRIQINFEIEMAKRLKLYGEVFDRFHGRLSNIRKFSYLSFNKKKKIFIKKDNKKIIRVYSTKINKVFSNNKFLIKIINFYFYLFILKFFKMIKFKVLKNKNKKKRKIFKKSKYNQRYFFIKRRNLLKRIYYLYFYKFEKRIYLKLNINKYLLYIFNRNMKERSYFVRNYIHSKINLSKSSKFATIDNKNKKIRNNLIFKRMYNKTNTYFILKSLSVVELLKSLVESGDSRVVKNFRVRKQNNYNITSSVLKKGFVVKKLPSKVIKRKFNNKSLYKFNTFNLNIDINTIFSIFFLGNIHSTFNDVIVKVDNKFFIDFLVVLILKMFKSYVYLLLISINFGDKKSKDLMFEFFQKIYISYVYLITILYEVNNLSFSKLILNWYNKLIKTVNLNLFLLRDYIKYVFHLNKLNFDDKFIYFNFISKFVDFAQKNVFLLNNFKSYFLFTLKLIAKNFGEIYSFNHDLVKRLLKLVDMYWFFGLNKYKYKKNISKFNLFLKNFRIVLSVTYVVIKLLFDSIIEHNLFYGMYDCFVSFLPTNFLLQFNYHDKYYFLYSIYNPLIFKKPYYVSSVSITSSFINFKYFFDILNFAEKSTFNLIFFKSINGLNIKFPLSISDYLLYVKELFLDSSRTFGIDVKFIANRLLSYGNKLVRVKSRDHIKSFLYGFKFHFVGRFTRKQQSASMWFRQGFLPSSSMDTEVDYGMFTLPLKFSACTVKVWLFRGVYVPKRTITYEKWL